MKNIGIVRKVDSLGRIVIPREYRKIYKITVSDPIEITALENGDIILRKVDVSAELKTVGVPMCGHLAAALGGTVMVSDSDRFLAGAGVAPGAYSGTRLPAKAKKTAELPDGFNGPAQELGFNGDGSVCIAPVKKNDSFGFLAHFSPSPIPASDEKLLKTVAAVLADSMQKY
ncbi:MAG: AbrB/MazE/SpoVT family DNA-binding domain-containing protein [Clostridiales bacterium]|jgi:bifunctional DNA-binding transcriptional regulator/antitoxin component of YhaV-PrlF toxin-antitoxin module|nr:AbrB/MazE/SpoVT family DNA-binding domain-containing protein [Clostridiales bacterium]